MSKNTIVETEEIPPTSSSKVSSFFDVKKIVDKNFFCEENFFSIETKEVNKMDEWVQKLKEMPDLRPEVIAKLDPHFDASMNQPTKAIKLIADKIMEDLIY